MSHLVDSWLHETESVTRIARFLSEARHPWECMPLECAPMVFGAGSTRAFSEYFRGTSQVEARSLEELCAWLRQCECLADHALFFQEDFWQHPLTFEQVRKGDCEDHALWAWRKLAEIGVPAHFTAGRWRQVAHAWVQVDLDGKNHVFDTTSKGDSMLHPVDIGIATEYCPALSVDHRFQTYVYGGYSRFAPPHSPA